MVYTRNNTVTNRQVGESFTAVSLYTSDADDEGLGVDLGGRRFTQNENSPLAFLATLRLLVSYPCTLPAFTF